MKVEFKPFPPFGRAVGFGVIFSNDEALRGISIVLLWWNLNIHFGSDRIITSQRIFD